MKKETAFRSLVLFAFLSVFLAMSAQDKKAWVFRPGGWWLEEHVQWGETSSSGHEEYFYHRYSIPGDTIVNGENCLKLMYSAFGKAPELYAILKTEGEKVFFKENKTSDKWLLLYDFGAPKDEIFQVYSFYYYYHFDQDSEGKGVDIRVLSSEYDPEYDDNLVLTLEQKCFVENPELVDPELLDTWETGRKWIYGIGTPWGIKYNADFGVLSGSGSVRLIEAGVDDEVVYSQPRQGSETTSWFNPEDTWEYLWVERPWIIDYSPDPVDADPIVFYSPDIVTREGKEYRRFVWNWKDDRNPHHYPIESYFLLREEDGAYYAYIDSAKDDEPEADESKKSGINPGEYLLYDFNMEVGAKYAAPVTHILNEDEGGALLPEDCYLADFIVTGKSVDHDGRRVLVIEPDYDQWENASPVGDYWKINIVEGIGPIYNDCLLTALYFRDQNAGWKPEPFYTLYNVRNEEGEEIFINPVQTAAGFLAEQDYQWVYGLFDSEGNVSYMRMKFNYLIEDKGKVYRRFKVVALSDNPDKDWTRVNGAVYTVREEEGKIWLLHSANYLELDKDPSVVESLIYDFGAADGEELTFYSPAGEKSAKIATGLTEVGGEDKLSYTFEGSDGVKCVEGIGITKGGILPAVNTEFHRPASADDESFVGAVLVAVYDGEGNLIFRQDLPDAVEAISAPEGGFTAPEDRLYDLQGRELREPVPGQPYIKGGKVFVETK